MSPSARREQLITAALELFSTQPPERVSVDDIVAVAEVSRPLFYRYFANIRELHLAALRSVTDGLIDRLARHQEDAPPLERLRSSVRGLIAVADEYRAGYIALLRSGSVVATSETDAVVDRVRNRAVELILRYTGITEPSPLLLVTLRCWTAVVEGALLTWLQEGTPARAELAGWLVDQLVAMVSATAAHDPALAEWLAYSSETLSQPSISSGRRGPGPT
ncbi:TetR/AcrR family transcriptional regulator [Amycolatopsis cihanbeyliensis]|uniref:TetR family transcriptional regulator n=1 Tax=Amycolatopsis cihanbeyliensis TaxID=1128664 RepID=A0A542DID0_AMYCI|nr:TetR/AcrR family transcriptional regulator [Amycolatopsis cihanbeyliensis]TQJ02857.1 TetR family transcriptional regulator [Amycolatopsis cihanbeyliensis]